MSNDEPHLRTTDVRPRGRSAVVLARRDTKPALHDLIDNLLDAARRNGVDHPQIDISWSEDGEQIRIEDNCGGMKHPEQVARLGESGTTEADEDFIPDRLGWAGIGGITAALSLGESITYRTRPAGADHGEEIQLSRDQFANDQLEEIPVYPTKLEEETSELIIEEVTAQEFQKEEDDEEINNTGENGDKNPFAQEIRLDIASNYELFLGGRFPGDRERTEYHPAIEANITVQGESVSEAMQNSHPNWPDVDKDWSWLPMDELYPRFLARFRIRPEDIAEYTGTPKADLDIDDEIRMFLVCGLLRQKNSTQNGFTVYANYRKVYDSSSEMFGRFGFLKFGARRGRFACYIGLQTTGSPDDIPTTGQKDALQLSSPISEFIFSKANALGKEYLHWDDDGKLPGAITMPYGKDHPASPIDEFGPIDYYGEHDNPKEYIRHKPGDSSTSGRYRDYPELEKFKVLTEFHGKLGIESPQALGDEELPAYQGISDGEASEYHIESTDGYLRDCFDQNFHELGAPLPLDEAPSPGAVHEDEISEWRELGQKHGRESVFALDGLPDFARPNYYEGLLRTGGIEFPENFHLASPEEISESIGFEPINAEEVTRHLQNLKEDWSENVEKEKTDETRSTANFIPESASREEQRVVARFLGIDMDEFTEMDRDEAWEILVERAERASNAGITFR